MRPGHGQAALGFWGKVPGAGDFIGRGLPIEFTKRWDRWMEMALPEALAKGGGGGVWCFLARKGVFGREPVCGAFALSRDRVGRRFPFLVAVVGATPSARDRWFKHATAAVEEARRAADAQAVASIVERVGLPGHHAPRLGDAARFWRVAAPEPIAFATPQSLAAGGLLAIFAAGGPPEALADPREDHADPGPDWLPPPAGDPVAFEAEPEPLDLDEILSSAGLLDAPPAPAPAGAAMPGPENPVIPEDFEAGEPGDPLALPVADSGDPPPHQPDAEDPLAPPAGEAGRGSLPPDFDAPSAALDRLEPSLIGRGGDPLLDLAEGGGRLERPVDPGPDADEAAAMMERPSDALDAELPDEDDRLDIDDLFDLGGSGGRR